MKFIKIILTTVVTLPLLVKAEEVSLQNYPDFQKKWPLITVRFRDDSGEQRFTWANEIAMKALEAGKSDYPDGSVFAKVSFKSEEDPAFISSKVPSGTRRAQLMIRDKEKYASTDGWGYFLFDSAGKRTATNEQACAACHRIVPERGYVFSQKMALENLFKSPNESLPALSISASEVVFEEASIKIVPASFRKFLPPHHLKVRRLTKPWLKAAFEGTADEIRPLLTKETLRTKKASLFLSPDKKLLSWVSVSSSNQKCPEKQIPLNAVIVFVPGASPHNSELRTRELEYCGKI